MVVSVCGNIFSRPNADFTQAKKHGRQIFCGASCANKRPSLLKKPMVEKKCACGTIFIGPDTVKAVKYCSKKCAGLFGSKKGHQKRHEKIINEWLAGKIIPVRKYGNLPGHIRRYLFDKFDSKCSTCGWSKINPTTGKVPLQVDHIDGDWRNNKESNLRLSCPNCHSLTPTFMGLNKGRGRPRLR